MSACVIIIERISRVPIYRTRWDQRALYNNTNNRHSAAKDNNLLLVKVLTYFCSVLVCNCCLVVSFVMIAVLLYVMCMYTLRALI